jgi:hypothetical protein
VLGTLNMGRCIKGYSDVVSLDIVPTESFTRYELTALLRTLLVDEHMGEETCQFSGGDVFIGGAHELLIVTSGYGAASCIFHTDGSLIEGCRGFAVHQMGVGGFGHRSLVLCSLHYGLRRDVFFSLISLVRSRLCCLGKLHIRLTLWCMNLNSCAGACARPELR